MGTISYDKTLKEKILTNFTFAKEIDNSFCPYPKIKLNPFSDICFKKEESWNIDYKQIYFIKNKSNIKNTIEFGKKNVDKKLNQIIQNPDQKEKPCILGKSEELNAINIDNNFNKDIKNELNGNNQLLNAYNIKTEKVRDNNNSNKRNINYNNRNELNINNNEENINNNFANINNNQNKDIFLNRKRNRNDDASYINKILKKIRIMVINSIIIFINNVIKTIYENSIGRSVIIRQFLKIDRGNLYHSSVEFDKEFLNKKLKDILSEKISGKYTNFTEDKNKDLIQFLIGDLEKGGEFFQQLFELSFLDCLNHINGVKTLDILNGLMKVDEILRYEEFKIDEDEINAYKYYFIHYEGRINDKKPRKSKNARNCA